MKFFRYPREGQIIMDRTRPGRLCSLVVPPFKIEHIEHILQFLHLRDDRGLLVRNDRQTLGDLGIAFDTTALCLLP